MQLLIAREVQSKKMSGSSFRDKMELAAGDGLGIGGLQMATPPPFGKQAFHTFMVMSTKFVVPHYYDKLTKLGIGAFGCVVRARNQLWSDKERERHVAIKKLVRPFDTVAHARRTLREIRLLKHMQHENILSLVDVFTSDDCGGIADTRRFSNIYIVTTLADSDLSRVIASPIVIDDEVGCFLGYQLMRGVKYLHSAGIIHRDLKPSNIGVSENCDLKILDFGLARYSEEVMTGYVVTRWYRAPEVMLEWKRYTAGVDIWSCGCILAEIFRSQALFPGQDRFEQLQIIFSTLGSPSMDYIRSIADRDARKYVATLPKSPCRPLSDIVGLAPPLLLDLIKKMLRYDASQRISAADCLSHNYFSEHHDPSDEPDAPAYQEIENLDHLGVAELKKIAYEEIVDYIPPARSVEDLMDEN